MKTFNKCAAQGDLYIKRIDQLPPGCIQHDKASDHYVVAHSESGHHHVLEAKEVEWYRDPNNDMQSYIVVQGIIGAQLQHLRSFDTHETILIPPGIFELRRQREAVPEGWRRVND